MEQRVDLAPPFGIFWGGVYFICIVCNDDEGQAKDKRRTSEGGVCAGRDPVGSGLTAVGSQYL